ncbi:hypothetical protein FA15DRAFT_381861 [Coprinopsis marcescibilis]|uniref:Nucleoside diphosphate kinase n=1 Tax=Coprinopsis marcescibilis TaxID=230819 RepID=A0A5C3KX00_COPMA|nr:hypothetical protein FA15DRAFT_381861 [Coprinopsis marcescibilis]
MASPNGTYEETNGHTPQPAGYSSPHVPITRTVAIIKHHALRYRFDIERRVQEANFEIVKERQMEFDTETDPDTLEEIFGEDADSLAEGPVWVYVLERRRAVEVWHTLMGPRDPELARQEAPNSLRALYGISEAQNGIMGSPDNQSAEVQVAALFPSSPPFRSTDLPAEVNDGRFDSLRSTSSSVLEALQQQGGMSDDGFINSNGYAPSSVTNPSTVNGSPGRSKANGTAFKARAIPATNAKPDIVPRMTKSAALRAGVPVEKAVASPRKPVTKERHAETFANVPGHKRSSTISVASTAAPTIAPRMTRAASLRLGVVPPPVIKKRAQSSDDTSINKPTFEGVPGHKRRETISVASIKPPTMAPRLNKSSALRVQKDKEQGPPTAFRNSTTVRPVSRSSSSDNLAPKTPVTAPVRTRPSSSAAKNPPAPRATGPRASSVAAVRPKDEGADRPASVSAKPRPRPSSISGPSIAPRTNRSAALRAAKQEAEQAAAAAAAAKKNNRLSRVPPSSFRAIAT